MNEPSMIGRKTYVDFPNYDLMAVPAKVDTGADNSAIWASDIHEEAGQVSFVLFDSSSPFYTGKRITTKKFKIISIKNSFGIAEYRYKVKIPAVIEGKRLAINFTLADRSKNSLPILIGRKTLKGKFIVDVALEPEDNKAKRVLFVSAKDSENVRFMAESVENLTEDLTIDRAIYDDIRITFLDGKMSAYIERLDQDLGDYDLIHFKTSVQRDITAALAVYATHKGVKVLDDIIKSFPTTSKLYEYATLCWHDIPIPDTYFIMPSVLVRSYEFIEDSFGLPFVLKGIHASRGEMNVLIRSHKDFKLAATEALKNTTYLVAQRFVPNTGDYRVLVMGKQISLVIYRSRIDESTHLNNTSTGSTAKMINPTDLPSEIQIDSIRATALMGRDIAGVDMVQDANTGRWYCFEVNDGPQIATGVFKQEKQQALAAYLQRELEK